MARPDTRPVSRPVADDALHLTLQRYKTSQVPTSSGTWQIDITAIEPSMHRDQYRMTCNLRDVARGRTLVDVHMTVFDADAWPPERVIEALSRRLNVGSVKSRAELFFGPGN